VAGYDAATLACAAAHELGSRRPGRAALAGAAAAARLGPPGRGRAAPCRAGASAAAAGNVLATVAVAAAEERLWRADAATASRPARALAVAGFALLHRRDGGAAVRYHLATGALLDQVARRAGLPASAAVHAGHNLLLERLASRRTPVDAAATTAAAAPAEPAPRPSTPWPTAAGPA